MPLTRRDHRMRERSRCRVSERELRSLLRLRVRVRPAVKLIKRPEGDKQFALAKKSGMLPKGVA